MSDLAAFLSSVFFTVATVPVAWQFYKTRIVALPWAFMVFIALAHTCGAIAVLLSWSNLPLLLDFLPGVVIYTTLLFYKWRSL